MLINKHSQIALGLLVGLELLIQGTSAQAQQSCIAMGPRTDSGSSGAHITNSCSRAVTVIVFGNGGMDYITMAPGNSINWTTGRFNRWKACWGAANTAC
jgi:hypothetical protein